MDQAISEFFKERKESWLKKNTKPSMDEAALIEKSSECEVLFSLEEWLPNAAKRAGQINISTHPCTFSHPSARKNKNGYASAIIAKSEYQADGFLRTGNVDVQSDALGNAAAIDVYKFLMLKINDHETVLEHLEQDTEQAKALFNINSQSYEELKQGFLAMMDSASETITSSKIKQVYFPVEGGYHLLSILTASGILFELRKRLDNIRFGDESTKAIRNKRKNREFSDDGYQEILGLTTLGYGGTKPQNISILNNQNGGKSHLLPSLPPQLKVRMIAFPTQDFFTQSLNYFSAKDIYYKFHELHKIYESHKNNNEVRENRNQQYQALIDQIIEKMWHIRGVAEEQYYAPNNQLPLEQKQWLLTSYADYRENNDDWLNKIIERTTTFIFQGYKKVVGKKALILGDAEFNQIKNLVVKNKEGFR